VLGEIVGGGGYEALLPGRPKDLEVLAELEAIREERSRS
jgi:hypothetical protein